MRGLFLVAYILVIALACLFVTLLPPVQAAEGGAPITSDNCELVGEVEDIRNYYCEPDFGPAYFQNSVGFVVVAE